MTMLPSEVGERTEGKTLPPGTELFITLKINASKLYLINNPESSDLNTYCELIDTNPENPENELKSIEQFDSWVLPGQQVRWEARRSDTGDEFQVAIKSIDYAFDKNYEDDEFRKVDFFNAKSIPSTDGEIVRAKVNEIKEPGKFVHIYNLNFTISVEGEEPRSFSIDPRLKMEL